MKRFLTHSIILIGSIFLLSNVQNNSNSLKAVELVKKSIVSMNAIKTMRYTMSKKERVKGEMKSQRVRVKFTKEPYQVYLFQEYPNKGLEVLYPYGDNEKALINTNGFPWVSVHLDPLGHKMRANQHHTLLRSGFDFISEILEGTLNKVLKVGDLSGVKYDGKVSMSNGVSYDKISVNADFKLVDYTVLKGENLTTIGKEHFINDYMILEANGLSDYDDVSEGDVIKLPTMYAKKMELYLELDKQLPLLIKVYDDEGLFEYYEYSDLDLDKKIPSEEFERHYKDYNF